MAAKCGNDVKLEEESQRGQAAIETGTAAALERSAPIGASFVKPDIRREIRYITQLAQAEDSRIVTVGNLVLFSTRTRDAWLLDPEDNFVVCLSREGEPQPFRIIDAPDTFTIEATASPKMACLLRS